MDLVRVPLTFVVLEFNIFLRFSWRDWSATIIPGSIFAVGAIRTSELPPTSILLNYTFLVSWLTAYIYSFNLLNQITGINEDCVNKPDRPIPSGVVTVPGAKWRLVATASVFLALAIHKPIILPETICWMLSASFMCLTSAGHHWFGKNCVALSIGAWALLSASWKAIVSPTMQIKSYILAVAIWAGLLAHIQDLRDIRGDALVKRKTMPLVFGDVRTRWITTFLLAPIAFGVLWKGGIISLAPFTLTVVHVFLGCRIMHARGSQYDHKTYMIYTYIFCLILAIIAGKDHTKCATSPP